MGTASTSSSLSLPEQKMVHSVEDSATLGNNEKKPMHNASKAIPHNNDSEDLTSTTDTTTTTSSSCTTNNAATSSSINSKKKMVIGLKASQTVSKQTSNIGEHAATSNTSPSTTTTAATKATSSPATATTANSNKKITLGLKVKPRKTKINSFYDLFAYD